MNSQLLTRPAITPAGAAHIIAAHLLVDPRPLTWQLARLAGRPILRVKVKDTSWGKDGRRHRTGDLIAEDGLTAAHVELTWTPALIPQPGRRDLEAGKRPAGLILGSLPGFGRHYRSAMAEGEEIRCKAQLWLGGVHVGDAAEAVTAELCAAAAAYWDENPPGSY